MEQMNKMIKNFENRYLDAEDVAEDIINNNRAYMGRLKYCECCCKSYMPDYYHRIHKHSRLHAKKRGAFINYLLKFTDSDSELFYSGDIDTVAGIILDMIDNHTNN